MTTPLICACGCPARLTTGKEVFPHRTDLWAMSFYVCTARGCDGRVGCHPGTTAALGTPANEHLRRERSKTHNVLDPIWRHAEKAHCYKPPLTKRSVRGIRQKARRRVYAYLAHHMHLSPDKTHIGMFTAEQCSLAREVLRGITYPDIRYWYKNHYGREAE